MLLAEGEAVSRPRLRMRGWPVVWAGSVVSSSCLSFCRLVLGERFGVSEVVAAEDEVVVVDVPTVRFADDEVVGSDGVCWARVCGAEAGSG